NQKWEMDSTVGDVMLTDGRRHHVVGVIDVFTRRRLFIVTRTSRANAIMSLIRLAILAWGVPEEIKTDNGADYVAEVLESGLLGLNIKH
ncbi:transposase, partial [Mycobacterium tuberculosis]|uniref:integrase catalytic domain-containing protein n=3 Tax=Bacteria TaxID=2 RepID=UPI000E398A96